MLMRIFCLSCHLTLVSLGLVGCQPVYYGATSIVNFEEQDRHELTGKDYKAVMIHLGEPSDIILDKAKRMIWIYELEEASSNPVQILPSITVGRALKRKVVLIGFSKDRRVLGVDMENSETRIIGLIGHIDQGVKKIQAKRHVRYVLDHLNLANGSKIDLNDDSSKPQSIGPQDSSVKFQFNN